LTRSPMGGWIGKSIVMLSFVFFVLRRLRKFFDRPPPTKNRNLLAPSRQVRNPFFLTFAPLRLCARYCDSFGCRFAALPLCLRGERWFTSWRPFPFDSAQGQSSPMNFPHFALVSFKSSSLI